MPVFPHTAQMKAEADFLAVSLLLCERERPRMATLAEAGLRWRRIERLARQNAVLGPLVRSILDLHLERHVESSTIERMRSYYENNAAQNAMLMHDAALVSSLLRQAGIESVALKGVGLLATGSLSLGDRHVDDVDLLVDPEAAEAAFAHLVDRGYRLKCPNAKRPVRHRHMPALLSPLNTSIEIHRSLAFRSVVGAPPFSSIIEHSFLAPWEGGAIRVPSHDDQLGILCMHVQGAHLRSAACQSRLIADIDALLANGARPSQTQERFRAAASVLESSLARHQSVLKLAKERGPCPVAELFLPSLSPHDVSERARAIIRLAKRPSAQAFHRIFRPRSWLEERFGNRPLPVLWGLHLIRALVPSSLRRW